jgi:hypothetical protein
MGAGFRPVRPKASVQGEGERDRQGEGAPLGTARHLLPSTAVGPAASAHSGRRPVGLHSPRTT